MEPARGSISDEELLLLASGELPEERRAALLSAVEADGELARRLAVYRYLLAAPRHLPTERPGAGVLRTVRAAARGRKDPVGWLAWMRWTLRAPGLAGALAVAGGLIAAVWIMHSRPQDNTSAFSVADAAALEIDARLDSVQTRLAALEPQPDTDTLDDDDTAVVWTARASELDVRMQSLQETLDDLSLDLEWSTASQTDRG